MGPIVPDEVPSTEKIDRTVDDVKEDEPPDKKRIIRLRGYIENENFMMYGKGLKKREYIPLSGLFVPVRYNQYTLNKVELHGLLDLFIGDDSIHVRGVLHGYLYPAQNGSGYPANRLLPNEVYLKWLTRHVELKAGRQVIHWGSPEWFCSNSFFEPIDYSELFFKDEDESRLGMTALSVKILHEKVSLQLVCVPVPETTVMPGTSSPWGIRFPPVRNAIPVVYNSGRPHAAMNAYGISFGGRLSAFAGPVTVALSGFRGTDRDALIVPTVIPAVGPQFVEIIEPKWRPVTAIGADMTVSEGHFSLYCAAMYAPNKNSVSGPRISLLKPYTIRTEHYATATAGTSWHTDGNGISLAVEGTRSFYLRHAGRYLMPLVSNMLAARIEKRLFSGLVVLRMQGIMPTDVHGYLLMPMAGLRFPFGLSIEVEGGIFGGSRDDFTGSYSGRDIIRTRLRYQF